MPSDISMSGSPAERTPTPGRTPNGAPLKIIRRRKPPADPLVRRKDPARKPPLEQVPRPNGASFPQQNGMTAPTQHQNHAPPEYPSIPKPVITPENSLKASSNNLASGFTAPAVAPFKDYPLVLTKKDLMHGFRYHVARFVSKKPLDPRNQDEFVRPIRLHRKDGRTVRREAEAKTENGDENKEDAIKAQLKAEREAKREAENAKVAPTAGTSRRGPNFKKTERVFRTEMSEEQRAQAKTHYEETVPWHLEDFENKQHWEGYYEKALSGSHVTLALTRDEHGNEYFRVVPVEKWYKFSEKAKFGVLDTEEAEALMKRKVKEPRWFMDSQAAQEKRDLEQHQRKLAGPFVGKWERGGGGSGVAKPAVKHENADADDLDFEEDRFADDEENVNLFEEDEETKEAEARIKRDQLQANVFDLKDEKEYEKQEALEKKEKEEERKFGKRVKKVMRRREKRNDFASDSENDPYTSESSSDGTSDSTETERRKAEDREKERADRETPKSTPEKTDKKKFSTNPKSSKPSSGRATPSGRPSKHGNSQPISRVSSSSNLKRPGSPLASDASGNESTRSRKKAKKSKSSTNLAASSQLTLQPPSRPSSPPTSSAPTKKRRAGSGSDTEAAGASGGEMSDGTRERKVKKLKLKVGSQNGSRRGSRAGSPDPVSATGAAASPSPPASNELPLPTGVEIKAAIPPEGISIHTLVKYFPGRVAGKERSAQFQVLLKTVSRFDKARKLLLPL